MRKVIASFLVMVLVLASVFAQGKSETYPSDKINVIVCKGAGGPTDTGLRYLMKYCEKYDENFKTTIENIGGANGLTGMAKGAFAKPDGYTLSAIVVELAIMQNIPSYNAVVGTEDFRAVSIFVCNPDLVCVKAGKYKDIYDFVDKMNADTKIGSAGTYGIGDLATKALAEGWNKAYTPVPYPDGDAAALQALLADNSEIDAMVCAPSSALNSQIQAGNVEVLCVVGDRHVENSNAPLISELKAGYALDLNVNAWAGLAVPKATPDDIFDYLSALCEKATNDPEFIKSVNATGSIASAINGADAEAFLLENAEFYAKMLKDAK
jgi:tripartite-type tricarboxylate transporter receptor subunit TctC